MEKTPLLLRFVGGLTKPELSYVTLPDVCAGKYAFFEALNSINAALRNCLIKVGVSLVFICLGLICAGRRFFSKQAVKFLLVAQKGRRFVSRSTKTQHSSAQTQEICNCLTPTQQHLTRAARHLPNNPE